MMKKRQVSDYEINGSVRRELTSRGIDLMNLRYRTSGGSVEVSGSLQFKESKSPAQVVKELFLLESSLMGIRSVKRVKLEFDDYEKKAGKWGVDEKAIERKESEARSDEEQPEKE